MLLKFVSYDVVVFVMFYKKNRFSQQAFFYNGGEQRVHKKSE